MYRTRISTKGQVVIPREVREKLSWRPGTELVIEPDPMGVGVTLRPANPFPPTRPEDVFGCLKVKGQRPVTLEEMDRAVDEMMARQG